MLLAGVHADDAAAALTYMRSLCDEPYLLAAATRIVISQRLVRRLCVHCRERYIPAQEQLAELYDAFGIDTAAAHRRVHELEQKAARDNVDQNVHVNTNPTQFLGLWRASDIGCEHCDHSGYQGVTAINEVLEVSEPVQKALLGHESAQAIRKIALANGFIPLALDGLVKSLRGVTTVSEVLRTAGNMNG
jgi:type II secretory ATPase GspE/PulE/Tfp pilus assembly ATPase PilB-like protein